MNAPALIPTETLPVLIDRATAALDSARTSAEVLEARDMARVAYDAAKSAGRMMRAKEAHDSLVADVHRAQANALAIRARAEMRLAEEYDAAQDRGEIANGRDGPGAGVSNENAKATAADLGVNRKDIHEYRQIRDAERDSPGVIRRSLDAMVERGEEPTRAALKREIVDKPAAQRRMDPKALWLWGHIRAFQRHEAFAADLPHLISEMTDPMRANMRDELPRVRAFLERMERSL